MAFWKIVGLVVTPTTCLSRTRSARLSVDSRPRLMSSSQIATPASLSSRSESVCPRSESVIVVLSAAGRAAGDGPDLLEGRVGGGDDPVTGEAELLEQHG